MGTVLNQITTTLFGSGDNAGVLSTVFDWITSSEVLPYFCISIGISLTLVGIKIIRSVIYGA